ncbi:peptidylprolyl isomerase [uncultured Mucilaginibacter sp.]|uniref:peptidylprolyl isomerase n=1 Tax=uncultured Mucilaginibacter sp. TaxID=797541 RepID=UPI0025DFDAB5|nr:peptidylprolyl isomerase [uncultured Mucilaginibacter sp.]
MNRVLTIVFILLSLTVWSKPPQNQYVRIKTAYGQVIIRLYNETPKHRDNFIKLTKEGFYNGTLFHRVIQNFMIQGGDPDSKKAVAGQALGDGDVKYTIPAEFKDSLFHKRGVLAAARDDNPQKASSGCQFYIVEGKRVTNARIDSLQQTRLKGYTVPEWQRAIYRTVGGTPQLDHGYTVYGEVVSGIDMVDIIAAVPKDAKDRPLKDVPMTVELLKKNECKQLDKLLGIQSR